MIVWNVTDLECDSKQQRFFPFFFLTPRLCSAWIFFNFSLSKFSFFFFYFLQTCYFKVIQAVSRAHLLLPPLLNPLGNNRPQRGSKNIFRGITMGRGPIWWIHSLSPFILSWYSLLVEMSVSEQKRRGRFHASVSISQEVNRWKLRFLRVAYQLNNHQKNSLLKVVV